MSDQPAPKISMIYEKRFVRRGSLDFYARHIGMIESTIFANKLEDTFIQEIKGDELLKKLHKHKYELKGKISNEMDYIITKD